MTVETADTPRLNSIERRVLNTLTSGAAAMDLPMHPLAMIFPLIEGDAFAEFVADIRENGLREPISVYDGKILDGRNRYRACRAAGIEPKYDEVSGVDPVDFVLSKNVRRRHLRDSQRALIAARLANMPHGGDRSAKQSGLITQSTAAQLLNVRERSLQRGRIVEKSAAREVAVLVERGNLSVSAAAKVAQLPTSEQRALAAQGTSAIVAEARRMARSAGRHGRSEYSILWRVVDDVCDALEESRLDLARSAAAKLVAEIDRVISSRRGK